MKEIGGYFELELAQNKDKFLHEDGYLVNSGRHALEFILLKLGERIKKIWLPYYTCEVILQPITRLNIPYGFYHINLNLELEFLPELQEGEFIIVNNYFGIKDEYVKFLADHYQDKIIIDQAQAWYSHELDDIKSFYSPRKFFGLPDGGIACGLTNHSKVDKKYNSLVKDLSYERFTHLLKRHELPASEGFEAFRESSMELSYAPVKQMSSLTKKLLRGIDMEKVKKIRRENFKTLNDVLRKKNLLGSLTLPEESCPMVYPYLTYDKNIRNRLIDNKVFVATYWPNVLEWCEYTTVEYNLVQNLIPLPVDQRYGLEEMNVILKLILKQ